MKLEEEIKQNKGFKDEWEKAILNIIFTGNLINGYQARFLKQYDITPEQYNILRILKGQHPEPASVNLLKERMLNKMSNASRLVEKLRKKGFVKRDECQQDRRRVEVCITDEGLALLDRIEQAYPGAEQNYSHITQEEAEILNRILDKFRSG